MEGISVLELPWFLGYGFPPDIFQRIVIGKHTCTVVAWYPISRRIVCNDSPKELRAFPVCTTAHAVVLPIKYPIMMKTSVVFKRFQS
jgi:hypothetical protein